MSENKYTVEDLAKAAINKRPVDFKDAFDSIMLDKIQARVDNRKEELAVQSFGRPLPVEEPAVPEGDENFEIPEGDQGDET